MDMLNVSLNQARATLHLLLVFIDDLQLRLNQGELSDESQEMALGTIARYAAPPSGVAEETRDNPSAIEYLGEKYLTLVQRIEDAIADGAEFTVDLVENAVADIYGDPEDIW